MQVAEHKFRITPKRGIMTEDDKKNYIIRINEVLELVRPYLQADGGDIDFVDLSDDLTVYVNLTGACGTCPMSVQTLKFGVEHALKDAIPEIKEVVAV
ncbi:MAG: NifU family protein [Bacteroidales bacterium]|nr:NifU family protein [Bacteroidales bacterium]